MLLTAFAEPTLVAVVLVAPSTASQTGERRRSRGACSAGARPCTDANEGDRRPVVVLTLSKTLRLLLTLVVAQSEALPIAMLSGPLGSTTVE